MVGVTAGPPVVFLGAARRRSRDAATVRTERRSAVGSSPYRHRCGRIGLDPPHRAVVHDLAVDQDHDLH
jgi:hypothetical protein